MISTRSMNGRAFGVWFYLQIATSPTWLPVGLYQPAHGDCGASKHKKNKFHTWFPEFFMAETIGLCGNTVNYQSGYKVAELRHPTYFISVSRDPFSGSWDRISGIVISRSQDRMSGYRDNCLGISRWSSQDLEILGYQFDYFETLSQDPEIIHHRMSRYRHCYCVGATSNWDCFRETLGCFSEQSCCVCMSSVCW